MLCIAPLFGISVIPATLWFFPSLILCISLGFAIDFIFACVAIELRGISWLSYVIRMAIVSLFSGTVIPFKILPFGLTEIFELQPFGSLGGAPLSLFVGTSEPFKIIVTQVLWNLIIWPVAIIWFKKSQERMVSFGG
jgi:ABC-2 type transport system permease protein